MPRAAWLAVGAAAGAILLGVAPAGSIVAAGLAALALTLGLTAGRRGPRGLLPLALGTLLLGLRGLTAAPPAAIGPLPAGHGPWIGAVESIGSLRDGSRPAVLALELDPPLLVAATLPWYPPVNQGDRVRVD